MADETRPPAQIAEDAKQTGLAAGDAFTSQAADAKGVGRDAATMVKAVASDVKTLAGDAINTARDTSSKTARQALDGLKGKAADVEAAGVGTLQTNQPRRPWSPSWAARSSAPC